MLGYTREELKSGRPMDTIAPESVEFVRDRDQRKGRGEAVPEQYEFKIVRKDGRTLHVETRVREILDEGHPAFHGCIRDVADRRGIEDALEQPDLQRGGSHACRGNNYDSDGTTG